MTFIQAIILGIVEGITEFLPISSTGHLILAVQSLNLQESEFVKTFEIAIQLGVIFSVVWLYWKRIVKNLDLFKKIVVAFLPTAVIGLALYSYIKKYLLGNTEVVLWGLFLGGVALFIYEKYFAKKDDQGIGLDQMSYKQAVGIGFAQAVAIVPGVSRAAATIVGGMIAGINRKSIVEFSFLLAIPTMAAATGLDLIKTAGSFTSYQYGVLAVGFIVSFITAVIAVKWLLKYIETHNFSGFGIYRVALAILFWLFFT